MQNWKAMLANDLIVILTLSLAIGMILSVRAIIKFSAKKGTSFFKSIPAYFADKKARKANKVEDELIEEGLKADRIAKAKTENYQGTDELKYFYNSRVNRMLKKKVKANKKNK